MATSIRLRFLTTSLAVAAFPACSLAIDAANNYITTAATTTTATGAGAVSDLYYFDNLDQAITGFSTAAASYVTGTTADNVAVRRNTDAADLNQASVWYATDGTTTGARSNLSGVHANNYGQLLLGNNAFGGSDNTFANGAAVQNANIERLDFTWNTPLVSGASLAFAVFDRGAVGAHDAFAIAAITGVDGQGKPTAFSSLLKVASGWGAAANPIGDKSYGLFRYANGDNISAATTNPSTESGTQGLGGIVIKSSDLGVANGTLIYGYALMATDVTATNSTQLADWTNATYYPTNTPDAAGGGIDLASINGVVFYQVPEPSSSAALITTLLAGGVLLLGKRATTPPRWS